MPAFAFLPFPSALIGTRKLRLENDFNESPTAAAFAADGTLHVLSEIFYNAHRYKEPEGNDLTGHYVTRFGADLGGAKLTPLDHVTAALAHGSYDTLVDLALVREGWLVTTQSGRSWVVDHEGTIRHAFAFKDWNDKPRMYRENFAVRADVRPDGRIVVAVAEADSAFAANVIGVSVDRDPTFASGQPVLRYLTSITEREAHDDDGHTIPYVRVGENTPFVCKQRPTPTLADAAGAPGYGTSLGGLCGVSNTVTVLALYCGQYSKHSAFQLALVDDTGSFAGALDLDGDSPYEDHQLGVAADQRHGRVIFKSKTRVHVFDERGQAIARVSLDAARKSLAAFHLLGASPAGAILLLHKKHRTLLLVDETPAIDALPDALAAAAAHYKTAWAAAKKAYAPVNARWVV